MNENQKAFFGFIVLVLVGAIILFYAPKKSQKLYKKTKLLLDTYVTISVDLQGRREKKAVKAAFERMRQIDEKLNRYDRKSEISKVNNFAPKAVAVSDDTFKVVRLGLKYSKRTGGKFDITIGPIIDLYDFSKKTKPTEDQIKRAKKYVNWRKVKLNQKEKTIALKKRGMIIDLGGVTKGYAADEAQKILVKYGVKRGLIDTGSSAFAFSPAGSRDKWKIGVKHPRKDTILTVLKVKNRMLSTSGDYQQYFIENGKRYHHIINPLSGYPARGLMSVTVVSSRSAAESDIISTAVFAMGYKDGLSFIKKDAKTEAILVKSDGMIKSTFNISNLPLKLNQSSNSLETF